MHLNTQACVRSPLLLKITVLFFQQSRESICYFCPHFANIKKKFIIYFKHIKRQLIIERSLIQK
uniref:Uncharacterized protein n=1 Tax=Anguilla anguilla TaxID=7936 RepID=A0A0E9XGD2_ANGAN